MNNEFWGRRLCEAHRKRTGIRRNVRLPASDQIRFGGEQDRITVTMAQKAIVANLQTNEAAFEAWSLALKVWCDVENVELQWEPPGENCTLTEQCHYQRFLYRAARFRTLFPEWFQLGRTTTASEALAGGELYLNVPGKRPEVQTTRDGDTARESVREAELEKYLLNANEFRAHFELDKVDRQFPVGLFRKSVAQGNHIFTGRKSAIDLIGIGKGAVRIFELKAGAYIPAGILSELIFYASVLRDAIPGPNGQKPRFQFASARQDKTNGVSGADVRGCKQVEAVLLGENLHPLVDDPQIVTTLNRATAQNWDSSGECVRVKFRGTKMRGSITSGYQFMDLDSH
jgi:hypothetical protein